MGRYFRIGKYEFLIGDSKYDFNFDLWLWDDYLERYMYISGFDTLEECMDYASVYVDVI